MGSFNKTRKLRNNHLDSTNWDHFPFRPDDIIINTYAKSGTTWMQQIVSQLLFNAQDDLIVPDMSPWLDMVVPPIDEKIALLEAQSHRRFIKSHLPADALVMSKQAKYIYVARDGRDVLWSLHNHHMNANAFYYQRINERADRIGDPFPRPDPDINAYFDRWLEDNGYPFWSFWDNVRSWWAIRNEPNVFIIHFANMKADLEKAVREIAIFLDVELDEDQLPPILIHCSFDYMKEHADRIVPRKGEVWDGGAKTFMNKGTNGRWRDTLSALQICHYEETAKRELGEECAYWLATGTFL